jgi:hypothetical protein
MGGGWLERRVARKDHMDALVMKRMQTVGFGGAQHYRNITILPLVAPDGMLQYRTLGEALAASDLAISEISVGGSVPELLVTNRGPSPVLLLDGEELAGAKQNRVLNTSILVKERSETRVPVSCTERGRWMYTSPLFYESGNVLPRLLRSRRNTEVSSSLETSGQYLSNQGQVWNEISELEAKAECKSQTSAMSHVFKSKVSELHQGTEAFPLVPGQVGLFVLSDCSPAGFDLLSLVAAYAKVHVKLVRSYVLESVLQPAASESRPCPGPERFARQFIDRVTACSERRFPSAGYGCDLRLRGEGFAGAALVHGDEVIHAAVFPSSSPGSDQPDKPLLRRRRWDLM